MNAVVDPLAELEAAWLQADDLDKARLAANEYTVFMTFNGRAAAFRDLFFGCVHLAESEEGRAIAALCRKTAGQASC